MQGDQEVNMRVTAHGWTVICIWESEVPTREVDWLSIRKGQLAVKGPAVQKWRRRSGKEYAKDLIACATRGFTSTEVVYGPSDRFIKFSQLSIGLAA